MDMNANLQSNIYESAIAGTSSVVPSTSSDAVVTQCQFNQQAFWEDEIGELSYSPPPQHESCPAFIKPTIKDYDLNFIFQAERFYGKFYEAKCKVNNEIHIMKIVEKNDFFKVWRFSEMVKVLRILSLTNFSTTMVNHFETPRYMLLAMKKIHGRNLQNLCSDRLFLIRTLCKCTDSLYPDKVVIELMRQLFQGLNFLHAYGIVHCNIQPKHIMIDECGDIKLCDFFYSLLPKNGSSEKNKLDFNINTSYFSSPEILQEGLVNYKADLWSSALTIIFMVYGLVPLNAVGNPTFDVKRPQSELTNALFKLFKRLNVHDGITHIIDKLLKLEPDARVDLVHHLNNPIFKDRIDITEFIFEMLIG